MRVSPRLLVLLFAVLLLSVSAAAAQSNPDLEITSPTALATVSGTVEVVGTVDVANLQAYFLEAAPFAQATETWTPVSLPSRQPVTDDVIAQWQTNVLDNGGYSLRVHAVLTNGSSLYSEPVQGIRVANSAGAPVAQPTATAEVETETEEGGIAPRPDVEDQLPLPVGGQMDSLSPEDAAILGDAGLTWMKFQVRYVVGDFSLLEVIADRINFAHEQGFRAFISIPGVREELAAGGTNYLGQYADFVRQVAELGPEAIQVWNEQNIDREWPVGMISGEEYVALLQPAYIAIKAADPSVMVVTGAPAPTGFFGGCGQGGCDDDVYYAQMATAGAAEYADCIGVHYNEGILPPTSQGGDPRGEYPTRYLPLMIQRASYPFRNSDIGLCFSELGYLSADGFGALPAPFAWASGTSVAEQAQWLRDAITVAAQTSSVQVELIIIFNANFERFVEDDPQGGFAIIRPDGSCPACEQIATLRESA